MQHAVCNIGRVVDSVERAFSGLWGAELRMGDPRAAAKRLLLAARPDPAGLEAGDILLTLDELPRMADASPSGLYARLHAACTPGGGAWMSAGGLGYDPPGGALDRWAERQGWTTLAALLPPPARSTVAVYVPSEALRAVQTAVWEAGAGIIGAYDRCSFASSGTGTYRPLEGANPYRGEGGHEKQAEEWRLEFQASASRLEGVLAAMLAAHPYEEVAYCVISEQSLPAKGRGHGRVGHGIALYAGDADGSLVARAAERGARRLLTFSADRSARAAALDHGMELAVLPAAELGDDALAFLALRLPSHLPPGLSVVRR